MNLRNALARMKTSTGKIQQTRFVKRIMVVSALLLLFWLVPNLQKVFFVVVMAGLSVLVGLYRRILPFYLGIELLTFTTVVACFFINPFIGWFIALIILSAQAVLTGHITIHYFIKAGTYTLVVFFCWIFAGFGIEALGKLAAVFINLVYVGSNLVLWDPQGFMDLPGNVINVFFNFWMFSNAAGLISLLM